jgi:glycosyltransferase involved in cell wall biosynthesis
VTGRRHLIVHQIDPAASVAGGIEGVIKDVVRYAPPDEDVAIAGVDLLGRPTIGRWEEVAVGGRHVRFLPLARVDPDSRRRIPHTARLVAGLLRRGPKAGDVIFHAHRIEVGAVLGLRYPRTPLVQFIHLDAADALEHRTETFWRFLPRTHLRLERAVAARAATTIVFNRAAADRLASGTGRVGAGRNWFDPQTFAVGADRDGSSSSLRVAWVGRFEPQKDPLKAVQVLARLVEAGRPVTAWFAGAGTLEPELRAAVAAAGLGDRVEFTGVLEPPALAERFHASDVLVMTSLWEGFPRTMVEALACGVPVVSTAVGDTPAVVRDGENGFIAHTGSAAELADLVAQAGLLTERAGVAASVADLRGDLVVGEIFARIAEATAAND